MTSFYLPPTNYGQPVPGLRRVPYEIDVPLADFIDAISSKFEQFSRETKADETNDPTHEGFPELGEYQSLGYPGIRALLSSDSGLLEKILQDWLELAVLEQVSTRSPSPGYAFVTLDAVIFTADEAQLRGQVLVVP